MAIRKAMLFLGVASLVGCLSSEPVTTLEGMYPLRSVNGTALPYVVSQSGGTKVELIDDAYAIYQGLTFSQSGHLRTSVNGQSTVANRTNAGNLVLDGNSIRFRSGTGGAERLATSQGNTLTVVETDITYVYRN
ncbi:MAG: hypothetical protein H7Z40_10365 [Phycisphaerae bacterium]|nr:hypothetical protein [Gemmatimonadaceae bacterium]